MFQTNFSRPNLVEFGGSAVLIFNGMSAITTNKPFGAGGGPALIISNCCSECVECYSNEPPIRGIQIHFSSPTNSLAAWFHKQILGGVTNHVLAGGLDFFVMSGTTTNPLGEALTNDDCRCIDQSAKEDSFRFVIRGRSEATNQLDVQFITPGTNALIVGGAYTDHADTPLMPELFLAKGRPYHVAVTFSADADGKIMMKLWSIQGTGTIDTAGIPYSSISFSIDSKRLPLNAFDTPLDVNGNLNFGSLTRMTSPEPILLNCIRIWGAVPNSIPAL